MSLQALFRYRAQMEMGVRVMTAGAATFALCHLLRLPQFQWAVLTSLIVMQGSVGASVKAMIDRMVGSVGGAVWGGAVSLLLPHGDVVSMGFALAASLGPLAFLAAIHPAYRVAPVTAAVLLLNRDLAAIGPLMSGLERLLEVGLGSLVALVVSLLVFPNRGHAELSGAVAKSLDEMARLFVALFGGLSDDLDPDQITAMHGQLRTAIMNAETAADAANQERANYLTGGPDPEPVCRTLRRLRNDLTMLGRAVATPLPAPVEEGLKPAILDLANAISAFLQSCANQLRSSDLAPDRAELTQALVHYAEAMSQMRRLRLAHGLEDEAVGRIFGVSFGFDQLAHNLDDLADRVNELSDHARHARRPAAPSLIGVTGRARRD